ncbi:hypothetical protein IFR05_001257 [Cadophora sp. M221]|nr:hypothetical protein IFR05_001257 [Cadophora sp. M221]
MRTPNCSLATFDAALRDAENDYGDNRNGNGRNGNKRGKGGKGKCYQDNFLEVCNAIAIKSRTSAEEKAVADSSKLEKNEDTSADKLQTDTYLWGYCRRGLDVVDTTGLCCKRGLDSIEACCNGWTLKHDYDDDELQINGWGNNDRCKRTLSGAGNCCTKRHY